MAPLPTTPPSMWVTRTSMPSITGFPTVTGLPTVTSSPTSNSSNLGRLVQNYIADNNSSTSATKTKTTTSVAPSSSRPSTVRHTMPTTPSSSPVVSTVPQQAAPSAKAGTYTPTVSMMPTASSSPTTSRFPSIAPTNMAQLATPNSNTNTKKTKKNNANISSPTTTPSASATFKPTSSSTTTTNVNYSTTSSFGLSQSCPGYTSGGTGQVEKEVIFTYMVQTKLTQPINSTSLLTDLEQQLLMHAANATLSCQDLSPFHIYELTYPKTATTTTTTTASSSSITSFAACQPTTTKTSSSAKSCWILQTHMLVTTDYDTTDWAKYTVLAAIQQELDQTTVASSSSSSSSSSSLLTALPQLVSTHYLGPNPQSTSVATTATTTTTPAILSNSNASSSQQPHNHALLSITILLVVLAAVSSAFLVGFLVWIRQRRRKRLLEDPDSSSFLFSFKSGFTSPLKQQQQQQQKASSSPSSTMDADLEMEMAEISDLLSRSKRRLEQHPPPRASFDSQDVGSKANSSTTSGTSNVHNKSTASTPRTNMGSRGNSVTWRDSESLASYGPSNHRGQGLSSSPTSRTSKESSSSSSHRHSQRKSIISTDEVEDNTRRRAERILEASASFHSRLSWTSSLDSDSVLLGESPSDDTTVQETLAMARSATAFHLNPHDRPNEQMLYYEEDDASSASPQEGDARYDSSTNTRDGLLRDSNHRKSAFHTTSSSRRTNGYGVKLPDLGRPTRGTRDVYHRPQQHSLL